MRSVNFVIDTDGKNRYNILTVFCAGGIGSRAKCSSIGERAEGGKTVSEIRIKENESIDSALRRFKRSCAKAGTLSELRKREHYESPSVKRRKKSEAARAKKKRYR